MRNALFTSLLVIFLLGPLTTFGKVNVVATSTDYASIALAIGGDLIVVSAIAKGDEDVHFVRPKPSFARMVGEADLLLTTGMDLELWLPGLIDKASNRQVQEGQEGFVSVSAGITKLEIPASADRSQGGVHLFGNPHIQTSPINMKVVARNIAIGLIKVDPDHKAEYEAGLARFQSTLDERLFGKELVKMVGSSTLIRLAESGKLISFLKKRRYKGKPMVDYLGGWLKKALPLRGQQLVTYHKNWVYFSRLFGLEVVGEVEPKPSIPPSPKDVERLINLMLSLKVRVVLAANYFDEAKITRITDVVDATPVIVPLSVAGAPGATDYFALVDLWLDSLLTAYGVL
jgi:zinc/manganese transport system substrate-binding protein